MQNNIFEDAKKLNGDGTEFWSARELQGILDYSTWQRFLLVIERAITACNHSGYPSEDHFNKTVKMVQLGSGSQRAQLDYHLSRYACYLIVQNGDPSKPVIAAGQTYFAIQTRRQELADEAAFSQLDEDKQRLILREQLRQNNAVLADAAHAAGVQLPREYAVFQNHGYKGLYGGLSHADIHRNKGLKKNQKILDHMGSTELAANLFRATQTADKLNREQVQGKAAANQVHYQVGHKVRQTIAELGGTMPEHLPTPQKSIKKLESEQKKLLKKQDKEK